MSRDPNAGKYQRIFRDEFRMAQLVLATAGGKLEWSAADYEAFRFTSPTATLIFYPHKTSSTGNISVRVRSQGSKDAKRAAELMMRLRIGSGYYNTFTTKGANTTGEEAALCKREKLEMGWARAALTAREGK